MKTFKLLFLTFALSAFGLAQATINGVGVRVAHIPGNVLDDVCLSSTGSDTFTCNINTQIAYKNGLSVMFRPTGASCSGAATLNISSLGAKSLFAPNGTSDPTCTQNRDHLLVYNTGLAGGAGAWRVYMLADPGGGVVNILTGTGSPNSGPTSCTAPSSSSITYYFETALFQEWRCKDTNSWELMLGSTGTGPYRVTGETGTAPSTPASGSATIYMDSTAKNIVAIFDDGVKKHGVQTKATVSNSFATSVDDDGTVHVAQPTDANLSTSDVTTNNCSTSKHGFVPKGSGVPGEFLGNDCTWSTPAGGGGGTDLSCPTTTIFSTLVGDTVTHPPTESSGTCFISIMATPDNVGGQYYIQGRAISGSVTPPYEHVFEIEYNWINGSTGSLGIFWSDGTKLVECGLGGSGTVGALSLLPNGSSANQHASTASYGAGSIPGTTAFGSPSQYAFAPSGVIYFRIADDGMGTSTSRTCGVSHHYSGTDTHFDTVFASLTAEYLSPTQFGFFADSHAQGLSGLMVKVSGYK